MDALRIVVDVAQVLSPVLYGAFIVIIYFQLRWARESVREVRSEFLAGGRPVVTVHDEYDAATGEFHLVVDNVGGGPAKNVGFSFSRPLSSSDGAVLTDLPLFTVGLTSLSPGAKISCFWDDFDDLMAHLRDLGLDGTDFGVTVRYSDLTAASYCDDWDIQPGIYEGLRHRPTRGDTHVETHRSGRNGAAGPDGAASRFSSS